MNKKMLIDAIIGRGFESMSFADRMTKKGLAKFTGNQWNEKWDWIREKLEKKDEAFLTELYNSNHE